MLPFTSVSFFVIIICYVAIVWLCKLFLSKIISFQVIIGVLSAAFILIYFPQPERFIAYWLYSYGVYYILSFVVFPKHKIWGILLICLPMILMKLDIRTDFKWNNIIGLAGLSYITFKTTALYIDSTPTGNRAKLLQLFTFQGFTPTLLVGPIDRFERFQNDLNNGYSQLTAPRFFDGVQQMIIGVFYSYVCAEFVLRFWLNEFDMNSTAAIDMAANMYGYLIYLFFDFAVYSAMAIGFGKMLGIDVPINFDKPFLSRNPQEFWRRFHKSLGDWLGDYFFKPMFKFLTKIKKLKPYPLSKQNVSLFATFSLMGCWNGFQFNFILSGMLFGLYSVVYNTYVFKCKKGKRDVVFGTLPDVYIRAISIFVLFNIVAFSIYIFSGRAPFL